MPIHMLDAAARLYMNGGATLSQNEKYTFRQARCVGGGTTVNNSVALKPLDFWWNDNIVDRWTSLGAELDFDELYRAYDDISDLINVAPLDPRVISPMSRTVRDGFARAYPDAKINTVKANLRGCIGCGRCNLGCQYGAKQSMLETTLPEFVRNGGLLVPHADIEHIMFDEQRPRVRSIIVIDQAGEYVEIEADKFVLATGCLASTKLLWRAGYQGVDNGPRTVGRRFSANIGSTVTGRFSEPQRGWDGQQIGYMIEVPRERMVIETAFAPPAVFGLSTSLWGDRLAEVFKRIDLLAIAVPVLGSYTYGEIRQDVNPSGFAIDYRLIEEDWRRLQLGMKMSAQALLAMGAEEIYTTRFDGRSLKAGESVNKFFAETGPLQYLRIETAHLQGGNIIHTDPYQGVVDTNLKVHGVDNLWITDASVMPAPITLNIQLTVMALAAYAAPRIVAA
jgi:choline dehydrogenase-like flavoprotein